MIHDTDDPQGAWDETSDRHHEDPEVPSVTSEGMDHAYTTQDGALFVTGKLHVKLLDEHNTEHNVFIKVLVSPSNMHSFNEWAQALKNNVFLDAHITHGSHD